MSDLPKSRVVCARPFQEAGVDYGGPFMIRSSYMRKASCVKAYVAIFVCMVTKAIHIELVTYLSTENFILTFNRFISRRGNPSQIFRDNGRNFLGAKKSNLRNL